jgi:hypothetical protein
VLYSVKTPQATYFGSLGTRDNRQQSIRKWQRQLEETTKGAVTKEFFPSVEVRLAVNLNLSPNTHITAIMTGHENIRSYLHRLKIIGCQECPCKHGTQTVVHLIFKCGRLGNERAHLKSSVLKVGKWPVGKSEPFLSQDSLKMIYYSYFHSIMTWINFREKFTL